MAQITDAWLAGYELLLQWAREERERLNSQAVSVEPTTATEIGDVPDSPSDIHVVGSTVTT